MGDYISEFNREQIERAKGYARTIMYQMPSEIKSTMGDGHFALLTANVERNAILTMQGYANWLATTIVRSQNFGKQKLPDYDGKAVAWISEKYDVPVDFIGRFLLRVLAVNYDMEIPLIGKITYQRLNVEPYEEVDFYPDEVALRKYEACFDWSKSSA